jgi:hypothetical protein
MTFEHLPSTRRYSYQPLASSPISSIRGKNLTDQPTLTNKAQSLGMFSKDRSCLSYFIRL